MDFAIIAEEWPLYLAGAWTTVQLVFLSLVCGLCMAVPLGVIASSRNALVALVPKTFFYCFRGTPLLVQTYLIYYGLAQFESVRESWLWEPVLSQAYWCALIAFSLNTAAYTGEILRGAIEQTPYGEIEAARACGMSRGLLYRRIILPSAFRRALPAYGNEVIFMLHGSVIAGVITIVDLFGAARIVNSRYYAPFEAYISAGLFYLAMTFALVGLFKLWEKRWHAHLRPRDSEAEPAGGALQPGR